MCKSPYGASILGTVLLCWVHIDTPFSTGTHNHTAILPHCFCNSRGLKVQDSAWDSSNKLLSLVAALTHVTVTVKPP